MQIIVEVFRELDGRLTDVLRRPDGETDAFASTLELLRALEQLDLRPPPSAERVRDSPSEVKHG